MPRKSRTLEILTFINANPCVTTEQFSEWYFPKTHYGWLKDDFVAKLKKAGKADKVIVRISMPSRAAAILSNLVNHGLIRRNGSGFWLTELGLKKLDEAKLKPKTPSGSARKGRTFTIRGTDRGWPRSERLSLARAIGKVDVNAVLKTPSPFAKRDLCRALAEVLKCYSENKRAPDGEIYAFLESLPVVEMARFKQEKCQ